MAGILRGIRTYFLESYLELRRVVWPTPRQAVFFTLTVILFSVIMAAFLGLLDTGFSTGIQEILKHKS